MKNVISIAEMRKFAFGVQVFGEDGADGMLANLVFDAATRCVTHIGVRHSRFFGKIGYLAYEQVVDASSAGVKLSITRAQLEAASLRVEGASIDSKSVVEVAGSGSRGTVTLVAVHPINGELTYFVARHLRAGEDTLLREEYVASINPGRITLNITNATLQALPPYRPDAQLQQEVEAVLYEITPLHIDLKAMTVRVLDGVLYLDGNISSSLRGDMAVDQASSVPGLLEIKNQLVGDDSLAGDLALALGQDPRTRDLPIGVYPHLGVVRLSGAVHSSSQKSAASAIAKSFPGVRGVLNDLVVDPKADILNVMASSEGGEAKDKIPGKYVRHTK